MNKLKSLPIVGFFLRYWLLTLFTIFFDWLALNDTAFHYVGSLVYVTAIGSTMLWTTLLLRHLFFSSTHDWYAASNRFTAEFWDLTPWQRQILATAIFIGMLLALAIVSAGVGK